MAKKRAPLPDYERPVMPFEREAEFGRGVTGWATVGFEFGIYVTVFFLGGLWLDGKFGTRPWLAALGAMLGVGVGMYMLIRRVMRDSAPEAEKGKDGDGPSKV